MSSKKKRIAESSANKRLRPFGGEADSEELIADELNKRRAIVGQSTKPVAAGSRNDEIEVVINDDTELILRCKRCFNLKLAQTLGPDLNLNCLSALFDSGMISQEIWADKVPLIQYLAEGPLFGKTLATHLFTTILLGKIPEVTAVDIPNILVFSSHWLGEDYLDIPLNSRAHVDWFEKWGFLPRDWDYLDDCLQMFISFGHSPTILYESKEKQPVKINSTERYLKGDDLDALVHAGITRAEKIDKEVEKLIHQGELLVRECNNAEWNVISGRQIHEGGRGNGPRYFFQAVLPRNPNHYLLRIKFPGGFSTVQGVKSRKDLFKRDKTVKDVADIPSCKSSESSGN